MWDPNFEVIFHVASLVDFNVHFGAMRSVGITTWPGALPGETDRSSGKAWLAAAAPSNLAKAFEEISKWLSWTLKPELRRPAGRDHLALKNVGAAAHHTRARHRSDLDLLISLTRAHLHHAQVGLIWRVTCHKLNDNWTSLEEVDSFAWTRRRWTLHRLVTHVVAITHGQPDGCSTTPAGARIQLLNIPAPLSGLAKFGLAEAILAAAARRGVMVRVINRDILRGGADLLPDKPFSSDFAAAWTATASIRASPVHPSAAPGFSRACRPVRDRQHQQGLLSNS